MKQIERMWFKKALRLGRRSILVYLQNDKKPTRVYINYTLSRGLTKGRQHGL